MTTYFIGDVHGCYDELMQLLQRIDFNPANDKLIFVGDLINRGPKSLEVLRFVRGLGEGAQVVLGNHDISLLAYAWGIYHGRNSDYPEMAASSDAPALLDWLRQQPLFLYNSAENYAVAHAGIPPRWSLNSAQKHARKAEKILRGDACKAYLHYAYGRAEDKWHANYSKYDKFRYRINGFTRLRYCDDKGEPDFRDKCPVGQQAPGLQPWFEVRQRLQDDGDTRIVFGHWAALGYYEDSHAICLDSGCAWGGQLSAITLTKGGIQRATVASQRGKN